MLKYNKNHKQNARSLRKNMMDAERVIWSRIRRKQLLGVQFYRQKSIAGFIVDFYAASIKLVIEIDGSQYSEEEYLLRDKQRDRALNKLGLHVLRYDNRMVLIHTDDVIESILQEISKKQSSINL
jgi:very-short-patch-repair endonuclease